jgi:hypothetical protein
MLISTKITDAINATFSKRAIRFGRSLNLPRIWQMQSAAFLRTRPLANQLEKSSQSEIILSDAHEMRQNSGISFPKPLLFHYNNNASTFHTVHLPFGSISSASPSLAFLTHYGQNQ